MSKIPKKYRKTTTISRFVNDMTRVAFNYIAPVDVEACTVKRKGKIIKGETEANLAAAHKERRLLVNAAKRLRRELRLPRTKRVKSAVYKADDMRLFVDGKEIKPMTGPHEFEF